MEWDPPTKAQSFQRNDQALKHSLLPVFEQPHLMPQVTQDQFPGRTEQNWVQPKEEHGLGAHGRYHWKKKQNKKNLMMCLCSSKKAALNRYSVLG